jgi:CDP-paratose 2-epimerase
MKVLITGGCGFVGSNLAKHFKKLDWVTGVTVFDNLHRRGSELNVSLLKELGINFVHGDVRNKEDLNALEPHDIVIEASAEPSVHAGITGDPSYVVNSNLIGAINCLDYATRHKSIFIFLSSSRVYSIPELRGLLSIPTASRMVSTLPEGIDELLVEEYHHTYGLRTVINRCGVLSGPGQFGKTDQGVVTLWMAAHYFGFPLTYKGFGGHGKQVRDILHVRDLGRLIETQINRLNEVNGGVFNIGGGTENSVSLIELTQKCEELTGNSMAQIREDPNTSSVDIPYYVSDNKRIGATLGWRPSISVDEILREIHQWLCNDGDDGSLRKLFLEGSR